jgi:ABC-type transport system involved in multi-copper enzyme maturation permease subunit
MRTTLLLPRGTGLVEPFRVERAAMSPVAEVALVAARELRKNLRSAKGLVLLALSLLGGVLAALFLAYIGHEAQTQAEAQGIDPAEAAKLTPALIAMVGLVRILGITVWLTPLLAALLGFDGVAGELQHRSVRYWTVRTRRGSYYVGKVVGLWTVVSMVTLAMDVLVWLVFVVKDSAASEVMKTGPLLWLISLPIAFVWCALTTLLSSLFKTPTLALLVTFAAFFALWVVWAAGAATKTVALQYAYPNFYEDWMLLGDAKHIAGAIGILAAFGAAYTGAGAMVFARWDV